MNWGNLYNILIKAEKWVSTEIENDDENI